MLQNMVRGYLRKSNSYTHFYSKIRKIHESASPVSSSERVYEPLVHELAMAVRYGVLRTPYWIILSSLLLVISKLFILLQD